MNCKFFWIYDFRELAIVFCQSFSISCVGLVACSRSLIICCKWFSSSLSFLFLWEGQEITLSLINNFPSSQSSAIEVPGESFSSIEMPTFAWWMYWTHVQAVMCWVAICWLVDGSTRYLLMQLRKKSRVFFLMQWISWLMQRQRIIVT